MSDHKTLAEALAAAQAEYPEVEKTAKANYGKYATLDSLIAKTRPILNKHGLSVQQFPHVSELGQPVLRTIIRHVSGETEQADTPLFMQKQDMQALGAAVTYARRYAWSAALGIASEHDDDAQSIVADRPSAPPKPAVVGGKITDPQRKRLFAIASGKNLPEARVKEIVLEHAGVGSSRDIPRDKYEAVVAAVEAA